MSLIQKLAEEKIRTAIDRGDLDDLPGHGKPLELDDNTTVPEELRAAYRLLKNSGYLPPELELRKEIQQADNERIALNCGYLYGENAVPSDTFEPIIPDADAHLFTVGTDWKKDAWTISAAFGYEYHEERTKNNAVGDPIGSMAAGFPVRTANGDYNTDIYLFALSLGYAF